MRTLRTEVAGLPAGTLYEVEEVEDLGRCVSWRAPGQINILIARVVDANTRAPLLYDAHVAALGCNPEELIPCGHCGCELAACLTVCNECGNDPDGDVPCPACGDLNDEPLGYVDDWRDGYVTCPRCLGSKAVEGINAGEREAALAKARAWQASQRENPVPAGIGGGR